MARLFLDLRYSEARLVDSIPPKVDPDLFSAVNVPQARPTCCRSALFDWAICYQVPGHLGQLTAGLPQMCEAHR